MTGKRLLVHTIFLLLLPVIVAWFGVSVAGGYRALGRKISKRKRVHRWSLSAATPGLLVIQQVFSRADSSLPVPPRHTCVPSPRSHPSSRRRCLWGRTGALRSLPQKRRRQSIHRHCDGQRRWSVRYSGMASGQAPHGPSPVHLAGRGTVCTTGRLLDGPATSPLAYVFQAYLQPPFR